MKWITSIICLFLFTAGILHAQDTLVYGQGNITNKVTKEPVVASISYQSLPFGNTVGMMSGSSFRVPLFNLEKYEIIVEAAGFASAKYMLDPAEANADRIVIRDVELGPPSSAAEMAESAHTVGRVMNLDNLIFAQGKSVIEPASYEELDRVFIMLNSYPKMVIQLEGHTDVRGNPKDNLKLSQERVEAVKTYLVSKGISKNKVKTKAFGGTQPLSRENTEAAHQMNRRVQVRIIQN